MVDGQPAPLLPPVSSCQLPFCRQVSYEWSAEYVKEIAPCARRAFTHCGGDSDAAEEQGHWLGRHQSRSKRPISILVLMRAAVKIENGNNTPTYKAVSALIDLCCVPLCH